MTESVFVFWGPALEYWGRMLTVLAGMADIRNQTDFAFPMSQAEAFGSLVFDIYPGENRDRIATKVTRLLHAPAFVRVVHATCEDPTATKHLIRGAAPLPFSEFVTCHASAGPEEAEYLAALFHPVNLTYVRRRTRRLPRPIFMRWIEEAIHTLREQNIDRRDVCVVGGGALEAAGIRTATDLDITVTSKVRERLGAGARPLSGALDLVSEGYYRTAEIRVARPHSDDDLISSPSLHFNLLGLKFVVPGVVRERKAHDWRPKDVLDVQLIDEAFPAPCPCAP